ncbi:hypothetical protein ES703_92774 [subsurface metagenome]
MVLNIRKSVYSKIQIATKFLLVDLIMRRLKVGSIMMNSFMSFAIGKKGIESTYYQT